MPSDGEIMEVAGKIVAEARKQIIREHGGMMLQGSVPGDWEEYLARVPGLFRYFTERRPEDVDPVIEGLKGVALKLGSKVTGRVDGVKTDLSDWTGIAAVKFGEDYLGPFEAMRQNQLHVVEELLVAVRAVREIIVRTREDIHSLGTRTLAALEGLDDGEKGGLKKGAGFAFAVVGAALAVAATVASGGSTAVIWMAILGGGLSAGGAAWSDFGTYTVGGSSVADVLGSMNDAARKLLAAIENEEKHLGDGLRKDAEVINKALDPASSYALVPGVVQAVTAPDPATFHPGPLAM